MEWLSRFIEGILQSHLWHFVSTQFCWVDWLTLGFALVGLIFGARQGLLRTLVQTAELMAIAYVTFFFHHSLAGQLRDYLPFISPKFLPITGFVMIALPSAILVLLIDAQGVKWFHTTSAPPIKILGGAVIGIFYGLFLWSFFSQPLILTPFRPLQKSYEEGISISGSFIKELAPRIYQKVVKS